MINEKKNIFYINRYGYPLGKLRELCYDYRVDAGISVIEMARRIKISPGPIRDFEQSNKRTEDLTLLKVIKFMVDELKIPGVKYPKLRRN